MGPFISIIHFLCVNIRRDSLNFYSVSTVDQYQSTWTYNLRKKTDFLKTVSFLSYQYVLQISYCILYLTFVIFSWVVITSKKKNALSIFSDGVVCWCWDIRETEGGKTLSDWLWGSFKPWGRLLDWLGYTEFVAWAAWCRLTWFDEADCGSVPIGSVLFELHGDNVLGELLLKLPL